MAVRLLELAGANFKRQFECGGNYYEAVIAGVPVHDYRNNYKMVALC